MRPLNLQPFLTRMLGPFGSFVVESVFRGGIQSPDVSYALLTNDPKMWFDPKGLYTNMGWWEDGAPDITSACEALLERCALWAGINTADDILDVGFGTGGPLLFWARRTRGRIWGVNRSPDQVRVASERVREDPHGQRIQATRSDATALCFPDQSMDCVLSVEAAFHFSTRETFLEEAWRVLRPGGRLVMTDIVPNADHRFGSRLSWFLFNRFLYAPSKNRVPAETIRRQLEDLGFKVELQATTPETIRGFFEWSAHSLGSTAIRRACAILAWIFTNHPPVEYILLRATKPATGISS